MRVELYNIMESLERYFYWNYTRLNTENISNYIDENGYDPISNNELDLLMSYMNAEDKKKFIKDYVFSEYAKMQPEEVTQNVFEFCERGIYDTSIISAVTDVNNLLDNIDKLTSQSSKRKLISCLDIGEIIGYLNKNGNQKDKVIELFCDIIISNDEMGNVIKNLESDSDRTKILLLSNIIEKKAWLPYIDSSYCRNQLVKHLSEYQFETFELIENINKYEDVKVQFDKLETEEEKAKFVTTISDDDIRLDFLSQITSRENRDVVINSFENEIEPKLKSQVNLVQDMIREYFEDTLGDKFNETKKEKMELALKKTDVSFARLKDEDNAKAYFLWDKIEVSDRYENDINSTIGFLAHEYEHIFSRFDYKNTKSLTSNAIEEGMADLFADLVINHYLEKHGEIEIDGKKVEIDYPYTTKSGYDNENAKARTILYSIKDSGKDAEALAEYVLGDKSKYLELVFGPEKASTFKKNQFGSPDLEISDEELYELLEEDFSQDDDSIYARRNTMYDNTKRGFADVLESGITISQVRNATGNVKEATKGKNEQGEDRD